MAEPFFREHHQLLLFVADEAELPRYAQALVKRQDLDFLGLAGLVAGAEPVVPPLPPAVLVGAAWEGGHVGRAHPFRAPLFPRTGWPG